MLMRLPFRNRQGREVGRHTHTHTAGDKQPLPIPHLGFKQSYGYPASHSAPLVPASPTAVTQMSLSNPTMLRTHSLSNADGQYDPYTDSRFRNSSMSLDEKSRTMSRSGSFRDGFEEGKN